MAGKGEIVKDSMAKVIEDTIYVAVGKDVEESKYNLSWALQYLPGKKLGILHVHQPAKMIPLVAGSFPAIKLGADEHSKIRELERQIMHKILDDYLLICRQAGVHAEKLYIEMNDIGEGIVELICQHNIKKLVMGAAASKHYSETMTDLKSTKAIYVRQLVPCQIWFTCKGYLIHTGDVNLAGLASLSLRSGSTVEPGQSSQIRSPLDSSYLIQFERTDSDDDEDDEVVASLQSEEYEEDHQLSTSRALAMEVAENSRGDVDEEFVGHRQGGETASETFCRARALESLYTNELRHRKEIEEELAKEKENAKKIKKQWDEERLSIMDQKLLLEVQVASLSQKMEELQSKLLSAEEVLKVHRKVQDDLQVERDSALKITEELLKKQEEDTSGLNMNQFFSKFSFSEIQQATCDFDPSSKIWEGAHGSIYKGLLHHTPVAIKVLNLDGLQGPAEFQQEVDALSKLRHPNLVTLIGVCPEACALVLEYLENGNLADRLSCNSNSPPLSWQTRVRIATELCSVLIFLHSSNPDIVVHGGLKPANILLDANFTCKLSEFRICRSFSLGENSSNMTPSASTDSSATFSYLDPHFLEKGELSPKSDIYSFGVILLQLLTGRSDVLDIREELEAILDQGNLNDLLDPLAGDWPYVQANQLAYMASRCCEMNPNDRPDLVSEVWRVLEPMRSSCGASTSCQLGPDERFNPPSYFMCPIYQEVMQNPRVAADGYTYEEEALKEWLESGHDTSPMTNLKLEHSNLVPNHALRSAIQEWLQLH